MKQDIKRNRIGNNPFVKSSSSQVGRIIEAKFEKPQATSDPIVQNFWQRIQDMQVEVNFKELAVEIATFLPKRIGLPRF